jgi:hypothetical protein
MLQIDNHSNHSVDAGNSLRTFVSEFFTNNDNAKIARAGSLWIICYDVTAFRQIIWRLQINWHIVRP